MSKLDIRAQNFQKIMSDFKSVHLGSMFSKTNARFEISTFEYACTLCTYKVFSKDWKGDNKGFHPI